MRPYAFGGMCRPPDETILLMTNMPMHPNGNDATETHHRRSIRLRGYDYASDGAYFVTLSSFGNQCIFGVIVDGVMRLNDWGRIVEEEWQQSAIIRQEITLDEFIVMPNHLHGIVCITNNVVGAHGMRPLPPCGGETTAGRRPPGRQGKTVGAFVAGYKAAVTKRINRLRTESAPLWMRNYYERIIRNDQELDAIRQYIANNPLQWHIDHHPL